MVLKGCIRTFLFIINTITVIFGLAITAIGIYCISKSKTDPFTDMETGSLVGFIVFTLFVGVFVLTLGLLGVFGSLTQSPRMMSAYVGLIVVVLLLELVLLVGSLVSKSRIIQHAQDGFQDFVNQYNNPDDDTMKKAVDAIQLNLECCGVHGQADYTPTPPLSCCRDRSISTWDQCSPNDQFVTGCNTKFPKFIGDVVNLFAVVIGFALVLDVVSMMGAFYVRQHSPKYDNLS